MDRIPKQGEFYRHFKNRLYQVMAVATHSETGEEMVVYQALYGDYRVYVRPLSMFVSEVDREKYPNVNQRYRFEKVILSAGTNNTTLIRAEEWTDTDNPGETCKVCSLDQPTLEEQEAPNPLLLDFLEEDTYEGRLEALAHMRGKVGQKELDSLYLVLDMNASEGTVDSQLEAVRRYLLMQQKYDGNRLR